MRPLTRHIILIGPDHFNPDQHQILATTAGWELSNGILPPVSNIFHLPENLALLKGDHAIYNLLPDLHSLWPNAIITPIIIGQKINFSALTPLLSQIKSFCGYDCLLVASVDFSHYLPATLADTHDAFTLSLLQNHGDLSLTEVDSPQSLYLLSRFSQNNYFHLLNHTNSGFLANNPDIETTTHFFGYYSRLKSPQAPITTTISYPFPISRSGNQKTLGDRFFYGVGETLIDPTLPDFVIATITTDKKIIKSYLPISANNFLRGSKKQKLIKNYFDSLPYSADVYKDYFWGRLTYVRN